MLKFVEGALSRMARCYPTGFSNASKEAGEVNSLSCCKRFKCIARWISTLKRHSKFARINYSGSMIKQHIRVKPDKLKEFTINSLKRLLMKKADRNNGT